MYILLCCIGLYRISRSCGKFFLCRGKAFLAGRLLPLLRTTIATSLWLLAVPCPRRFVLLCIASALDFGIPYATYIFHESGLPAWCSVPFLSHPLPPPAVVSPAPWGLGPIIPGYSSIRLALLALHARYAEALTQVQSILRWLFLMCCRFWPSVGPRPTRRAGGRASPRARFRSACCCGSLTSGRLHHPWKAILLLYLVGVDANTLHVGCSLWQAGILGGFSAVSGVQLYAHGFHEGRPVFSTGPVPTTSREEDLCEVLPLGRPGNHLLTPSRRPGGYVPRPIRGGTRPGALPHYLLGR